MDLKKLNRRIELESIKMEILQLVLLLLNLGDWMFSIDLSDIYLHFPIHPDYQKFLCFVVHHHHLQFWRLPIGLSISPRRFTKLLLPIIELLKERRMRAHHYLDVSFS